MLAAGLATFNALYTTQAMLPTFVAELHINPTLAALTVSATTGALALCIVPASILSERFGRGRVLLISALLGSTLGLLLPLTTSPLALIAIRALQGVCIAGVPAVAMTWLSEEVREQDLPHAMGIYIAGTTVGGLTGRLIPAGVLEIGSWRTALVCSAGVATAMALLMIVLLPAQRHFQPKSITARGEFLAMLAHLRNPRLLRLYIIAFLGMGAFVSLYNYTTFRMVNHFGLSEALVGAVFLLYLAGTWSSARAGRLVERVGEENTLAIGIGGMILGLALLMLPQIIPALVGLGCFTAGFFAMHSTASAWIGRIAQNNRAEASSMYLFSYYVGSSLLGWAAGYVFTGFGWGGLILAQLVVAAVLLGITLTMASRRRKAAPSSRSRRVRGSR